MHKCHGIQLYPNMIFLLTGNSYNISKGILEGAFVVCFLKLTTWGTWSYAGKTLGCRCPTFNCVQYEYITNFLIKIKKVFIFFMNMISTVAPGIPKTIHPNYSTKVLHPSHMATFSTFSGLNSPPCLLLLCIHSSWGRLTRSSTHWFDQFWGDNHSNI